MCHIHTCRVKLSSCTVLSLGNSSPCCSCQVDLGGWLSESSPGGWLYRPALGLGLVDQLVERMLSSVTLIKDEVEQQRFRVSGSGKRGVCVAICCKQGSPLLGVVCHQLYTMPFRVRGSGKRGIGMAAC